MNQKDKLIKFIIETTCESLDSQVILQAKKCFLDLSGVICAGAKNNSSKKAAQYVRSNFPLGECTILSTGERVNLIGAALANGMSANALDLDDGYSLLRGHPGSGFFGALISAAEYSSCSYGEFLSSLVISYEVSVRQGYAIRDYYRWDHSSGCYSAFAVAAGVGKLLKLNENEMEMALGISDFMAPLCPSKRSCYAPSMNKDGVYFGQHVGTQAVMMAKSGITGKYPVIFDDEYASLLENLGDRFYIFDLYIKFHSCCRWVHSPIMAVDYLFRNNKIIESDIKTVDVFSFGNAGTLYKDAPKNEDEAQYNIKYPIAAQIVFGNCGPIESSTTKMLDPRIPPVIDKICFHHEPEFDKEFPLKRISRVELTMIDGKRYVSPSFEPMGENAQKVSEDDLIRKIYSINKEYSSKDDIEGLVNAILFSSMDTPFSIIYSRIKHLAMNNNLTDVSYI